MASIGLWEEQLLLMLVPSKNRTVSLYWKNGMVSAYETYWDVGKIEPIQYTGKMDANGTDLICWENGIVSIYWENGPSRT